MEKDLNEVWDYLRDNKTLGDFASVGRGKLHEEDRPTGECWACRHFAQNAFIHESPSTAKCCIDCDAYAGE